MTGDELEEFIESIAISIRGSFIVGAERTHMQDIRYAFSELVDIAIRALSPGINDPFTAVNCVDRIHAELMLLKERPAPSPYRLDKEGHLCLIATPVSFEECIKCSLDAIRNYADGNPMVISRIDEAMQSLKYSNDVAVRGKAETIIESPGCLADADKLLRHQVQSTCLPPKLKPLPPNTFGTNYDT